MEGLEYRKCTAICNSAQGQCILIKKRDFEIRIMHEEGALSYLQERLAIKNQRMKEKIEAIGKQIDNFKNFIYDDPKDFKRQIDFKKIYRTQQGRQSLDLVTLSELKEMIQTGQNPSKKKKKIKDSQQPDINLYEEGLIKSQNEIVLPKEEDEYYINSPKRSQSPEKNEKKPQENILQEHFMELLHQHIHKQKKKEQKNVMAQTQYNTQKSQGDQSQLQQLTTHQQLQNQQTLQKFSSFSKEGQDYSPTLHSMNKSQILSSNQKSSNKPNQPSVSMMNLSTNDFSPQITNAKFQKLRLQQSLIQPPNIVKLYDNPYGEEEKKGNKRQLLSSIYFNKNTNQSRQQLPSDSGKRSTMNTYNIFSQSQTEFPQFSNSKQVVTDIEVNRKDLKQRYQKKGKSLSQINLSQQNIAVNNIPKEDSYQIKIQSEDGNNNSNNNIINNNIIYSTEQTNHNDFKNEIVPLLLSPPTLHTNIDKQKRILAYTKQNTPDKFITGTQTFYLPEDKSEAVISSQIYQDSSQQLYRKSSSGNILIMSPAQGVPSEQFLINPKNMNDSEQITCTYSINTLTNYNNTQNNLPPMSSSSSQQKQQPSQQKEKGMSYRSISAIIQNSIKNIDPLSRDSIIRSSGRLNESVRLQHQIQISSSPAKGLGRQYVSFSKSPSKLQPYKFQKEYQAASNKQKDKNDDRFFQLSKQKVRIYEAIHQNPKTIKFIKDSLKEHHQSSMNNSSAPIKSPKQKLLPIKVRQSLLPQSLQNSPLISRQSEINTAHSELSSPVHTQKHSLLLKNIARKSEYSLQANESNINNPQRNNNFLPN